MTAFMGIGASEYLLLLLAISLIALPIIAVLRLVIRAFRDRGRQPTHSELSVK